MALALGMLLTAVGMMSSGRVGFVFFSAPEADNVYANVTMTSGSTTSQTQLMLAELERALNKVESKLTNGRNDLVSFSYGVMGRMPQQVMMANQLVVLVTHVQA